MVHEESIHCGAGEEHVKQTLKALRWVLAPGGTGIVLDGGKVIIDGSVLLFKQTDVSFQSKIQKKGSSLIFLKLQIRQKMENINRPDCFFASTLSINSRKCDVRASPRF